MECSLLGAFHPGDYLILKNVQIVLQDQLLIVGNRIWTAWHDRWPSLTTACSHQPTQDNQCRHYHTALIYDEVIADLIHRLDLCFGY